MNKLTIRRPDDWHVHFRDGALLETVALYTSAHFARAIIMPNLVPPLVTREAIAAYRRRIYDALPPGAVFEPLMTLYLTEDADPQQIVEAARDKMIHAVKLYPAGATTNSQGGVRDFRAIDGVLARMEEIGLPLLIHGEVTSPDVDIFDREAFFIDKKLDPLRRRFPGLPIVLEHVTTCEGVEYVRSHPSGLAATITPHHLVLNRNDLLAGGVRPHYYCLPVVKRERHRLALCEAALSGDPRFFFGSDSAPHIDATKEAACGCAGIFNAITALGVLAHVFEQGNSLDRLENFVSRYGAEFYGVKLNEGTICLTRDEGSWSPPAKIDGGPGVTITVFDPGFPLHWRVVQSV